MCHVVRLDLRGRDVDRAGDLLEELLGDDLGAHLLFRLVLREALLCERLLVAILAAPVELLLQLLDALVDLRVGDLDAPVRGLLRELGALDEERDRLTLQLLVLGGTGFRKGPLLRLVALLRASHQRLELVLGHLRRADHGHITGPEGRARGAAAAGDDKRKRDEREKEGSSHGKCAICSGFTHAAWRAASIASTSLSACGKPSSRRLISRFAVVYTAVSTRRRRSRSSAEPSTIWPTLALPPRKTK